MIDKERREDEVLKNCIQEAYGCSDDQLLAELDEIEAELSEEDLPGVEERIYERLMARVEEDNVKERDFRPESLQNNSEDIRARSQRTDVIRVKNKKVLLVAMFAATFIGMLSISSGGRKNFFLKRDDRKMGTVLDSGKTVGELGNLTEAYAELEKQLEIPVLKMFFIPEKMYFEQLSIIDNKATFVFNYGDKKIYFIQTKESKEISVGLNSDRQETEKEIYNEWLSMEFTVEENALEDGEIEYTALLYVQDASYRIVGILPKEDFEAIVKNLNF